MSIEDEVRAWAKGSYPQEAGVELLIQLKGSIHAGQPWVHRWEGTDKAGIDIDLLLEHTGAWSGGERRMVRIIASLLGGPPCALDDDLAGLDRENVALVLAAMAHAAGTHENALPCWSENGEDIVTFDRPGTLYPWPAS